MKINVQKNISNEYEDINILIGAPENSEEVDKIIEAIAQISQEKNYIIGTKNSKNYIIKLKDIICFYSEHKNNYAKTKEDNFKIRQKLYELENTLGNNYVRISNSCIVNIVQIKAFDASITGTIEVIFKDNTKEYVSRRKIKEVLKKLKEWGN